MTCSIAAGLLMVAWSVWAMCGSVISPDAVGRPASEALREEELLRRLEGIEQRLPEDFWWRYDQFVSMRKDEALRPGSPEHEELIRMTDELEGCHAVRLELLSELAKLRGTSLAGETAVRTRRGPFSMTVIEWRSRGERFDYEVKFTVESDRFDRLAPAFRRCFESFREMPGTVPAGTGRAA
jgi:hypothetical protein